MCMHGPWEWFPMMWIFPMLFLVVILLFLLRGGRPMCGSGERGKEESAREIIDRRYAKGEITKEEFERMKKDIQG